MTPAIPTQIDQAIGEMLGAFQLGDVETMHKHYADNATFVSGSYVDFDLGRDWVSPNRATNLDGDVRVIPFGPSNLLHV